MKYSGLLCYPAALIRAAIRARQQYCTILYKFSVDNFRNTFDHNTWTKPINTSTKQNYSDPRNCPAIKNVAIGTLMFQYLDCYYYDVTSTIWTLILWVSLIEGRHNDCHAKTLCPIPNVHFHFSEGSIPQLGHHYCRRLTYNQVDIFTKLCVMQTLSIGSSF